MPASEGRAWLTSKAIADRIVDRLSADFGEIRGMNRGSVQRAVREAYEATGYTQEFKILRLVEKVKDAMYLGVFGPLYIPNTVDQEGERLPTPVGVVAKLLKDVYTPEFLDTVDEEGEVI